MGTRGCWGFRLNRQDKLTYNHWDSYPTSLGETLVEGIKNIDLQRMYQLAHDLEVVDGSTTPTEDQIARLSQYSDTSVSNRQVEEWYCLLRDTQGSLVHTLECGYMIDNHDFMEDSLFCEWAYVINLDDETFEVYRGFQTKQHNDGRYAGNKPDDSGYYPVALWTVFPLSRIPDNWSATLEKQAYPDED